MENLFNFSALTLAAIPLCLGIVAAIRQLGLPSRFAPIVSIVIGIGLIALTGQTWQADISQGIIVGLSASGLWSGSKALFSTTDQPVG
jgi:hypothetical protein